ncbi:hypothetical protein NMY22_g12915 [Coprinellus aureogranulatus]|nr:hypothetical protein NMY22_g12915 [Coprinellus aureogranulatus]
MTTALCIFALLLHSTSSAGAPFPSDAANDTDSETVFGKRSMIEIIWTCLTVVFASTWVCVHPNVAGYDATPLQRWGTRGRLFLNALLFPDRLVRRSFAQWMGCRALYREMERRASVLSICIKPSSRNSLWTYVHAHLIQMGGVAFRSSGRCTPTEEVAATEKEDEVTIPTPGGDVTDDGNQRRYQRWYEDFNSWEDDDIRKFFDLLLTENQIEDRSKADGLSKAFVVIQCLWFLIQCIGRAAYALPLTELEVTCLAFIACNLAMYSFWWGKPLDVMCPVEIQRGPRRQRRGQAPEATLPGREVTIRTWVLAVFRVFWTGDVGYLAYPSQVYEGNFHLIQHAASIYPAAYFYTLNNSNGDADLLKEWGPWVWLAYSATPAIFGALHSIAWYGPFPSVTEQILWRVACIIPALHVTLYIFQTIFRAVIPAKFLHILYFFILSPINFAARFVFIVLPLLQFRKPPPLVRQDIQWSNFLPHV